MSDAHAAVVLAGGRLSRDLAVATGAQHRALIPINGRPLLERVLDALRGADIDRVAVVGARALEPLVGEAARLVPETGDLVDNLFAGLRALDTASPTLVCTADVPFLRAAHVIEFTRRARATRAALAYPIVSRARCEAVFPGARRTYARLREGVFTGGNLVLVEPRALTGQEARIRALYAARKSPLRLASLLGLPLLWGFLTRTVTLLQLEWKFSQLLGAPTRAVMVAHAELAFDVDKPADLHLAEQLAPDLDAQSM